VAQLVAAAEPTPEEVAAAERLALLAAARPRLAGRELELRRARAMSGMAGAVGSVRLRPETIVALLVFAGALAWALAILAAGRRDSDAEVPAFLLMILSAAALVVALVKLAGDLAVPGLRSRSSPLRGLRTFLGALRFGRFATAYACLVPGERGGPSRERPGLRLPGVRAGESCRFDSPAGFARYWRPMIRQSWSGGRSVRLSGWREVRSAGDFALAAVEVQVTKNSVSPLVKLLCLVTLVVGFIFIPGSQEVRVTLRLTKLLRRIDGQWHVVCGEVLGPEDDPAALDEAVRVAAMSESELAALAAAGEWS
jgi:hypothetical protein